MGFIVQDLLDYAKIKADKFRKNTSTFNIIESVEKVMCVQRQKAEDQNIQFYATYNNIRTHEEENEISSQSFDTAREIHSPDITTDE